jgi:hypothetical protein
VSGNVAPGLKVEPKPEKSKPDEKRLKKEALRPPGEVAGDDMGEGAKVLPLRRLLLALGVLGDLEGKGLDLPFGSNRTLRGNCSFAWRPYTQQRIKRPAIKHA